MTQLLAQIGLTTTVLESLATTIGAGMLVGGFALGIIGLFLGRSQRSLERRAFKDGYLGGLFGVGLLIVDATMRYVV
jgi:hypothetical protein